MFNLKDSNVSHKDLETARITKDEMDVQVLVAMLDSNQKNLSL